MVLVWEEIDKEIKVDHICVSKNNPNGYVWCSALTDDYQIIKYWMPLPVDPEEQNDLDNL